ncbi:MAG: hypothetical protein ACI39H_08595 [Lachnospiraceae bacterium]
MNEQLKFLESMKDIARMGKEGNGRITREQVISRLGAKELNEAQWEVMGEFLFSRQVLLEGYTPKPGEQQKAAYEFSEEEKKFMKYYEADIAHIERKSEEALEALLQDVKNGIRDGAEVYNLLLPLIYEIAKSYANGKEQLGDLVQETNLKVFTLLENIAFFEKDPILDSLKKEIDLLLKSYVAQGEDTKRENNKIADKLNQLVEAVEVLKEQNAGYTIEELSEFLEIPIEEIGNLLRIAGENINEDNEKSQ